MRSLSTLRTSVAYALLACLIGIGPAEAQAPSDAAFARSQAISADMNALSEAGDAAAARQKAVDTSKLFAAEGEAWLAASYAVAAAEYDIQLGNAARIDAETYPRLQELLGVLDPVENSRGDTLLEVLMDAKGALGDHARQAELGDIYESRIRQRSGAGSEADLTARLRVGYSMLQSGDHDGGHARLRAALLDAARTDHHAFTITSYMQVAERLYQSGLAEQAAQIFSDGEKTRAARADVRERADFYLAYGNFQVATKAGDSFVPTFSTATTLFEQYYGSDSKEVIHATDLFSVALEASGQLAIAANLATGNYDKAVRVLGPDDTITWRLANNLADILRGMGAPSRALEYDTMVLEKRAAHYGKNHFNTLVSANNNALDYLDLRDYPNALRLLQLNREIAVALEKQDPNLLAQADAWILYTRLMTGDAAIDAPNIATMDLLTTNADYPTILGIKAANLLAAYYDTMGDATRSMKYLQQALDIAGSEIGLQHPLAYQGRLAIANAKAKTDPVAAAEDFASLDKDMLVWNATQVNFSGNRDFAEATRALADDMLYDYAQLAEIHPSAVAAFADAVRRWPSLEDGRLDTLRKIDRLIDPNDTEMRELLRKTIRASSIMHEILATGAETEEGMVYHGQVKAFEEQINRRLADRYEIDQSAVDAPLPAAMDILQSEQALVAYFITRKWRADRESAEPYEDTRLYAIVSRKGQTPRLHNLGDPRTIISSATNPQMASLRTTRSGAQRGAVPMVAVDAAFSGLYQRLVTPLEADLAEASTLFVVPDGQLFALPFSLLRDGNGQLLEQRFTIRLLTRPEALFEVGREQTLAKNGRAVLAGGLNYANGAESGAEPLPGTLQEVETIDRLLRKDNFAVDLLTGDQASETTLRRDMEGATIAHLATHGAYRSARTGGAADVDTLWQSEVILSKSGDRRSTRRNDSDGRLYAFELMTWDLTKLDLLVLSACETGRGEETFVGGLRGLPTAINIAGAKRSLLTLWPVADEGTAAFMVRFYEKLIGGETYAEALRQTRRDAIAGKVAGAGDPLVWAAFVMFEN